MTDSDAPRTRRHHGIDVFDGSNPAYYKPWSERIIAHRGIWLNGQTLPGIWREHIVPDGCFITPPSVETDLLYLARFRPELSDEFLNRRNRNDVAERDAFVDASRTRRIGE